MDYIENFITDLSHNAGGTYPYFTFPTLSFNCLNKIKPKSHLSLSYLSLQAETFGDKCKLSTLCG